MTDPKPTSVYVGRRLDMIEEVAAFDPVANCDIPEAEAEWLVLPTGDAQWDTEWFPSYAEALAHARVFVSEYGAKLAVI